MGAVPPALDRALLDELRLQRDAAISDMQLFDGILNALQAMTPEGRAMALGRLVRAFRSPKDSDKAPSQPSLPIPQSAQKLDLSALTYGDAVELLLILSANNRPLSTKALLARLQTGGKTVTAKDAYRVLYRTLAKSPKFVNIAGQWALAEWYPQDEVQPLNAGEAAALKASTDAQIEEDELK